MIAIINFFYEMSCLWILSIQGFLVLEVRLMGARGNPRQGLAEVVQLVTRISCVH